MKRNEKKNKFKERYRVPQSGYIRLTDAQYRRWSLCYFTAAYRTI